MPENSSDWLKRKPIAHRGLHDQKAGVLENTRTAFARAIDASYAIECDLQISADGEAMVFHDDTLDRLTLANGPVKALTADQLAATNLKIGTDRIQTLEQLLEQVNARVPLIVELKSLYDNSTALAERAIALVSAYRGDIALMSFDPVIVGYVAKTAPDVLCGAVIMPLTQPHWTDMDTNQTPSTRMIDHIAPDFISYDVRGLPDDMVSKFRQNGKPIICWTIRDKETAKLGYKYCDQITFEDFLPK